MLSLDVCAWYESEGGVRRYKGVKFVATADLDDLVWDGTEMHPWLHPDPVREVDPPKYKP